MNKLPFFIIAFNVGFVLPYPSQADTTQMPPPRTYAIQLASYPTRGEAEAKVAELRAANPDMPVTVGFRNERHTVRVGEHPLIMNAFLARIGLVAQGFEDCFIVWQTQEDAEVTLDQLIAPPDERYRLAGIAPAEAGTLRDPAVWTYYPGTTRPDHYRINTYARIDRLVAAREGEFPTEVVEEPNFQRLVALDEQLFQEEKDIVAIRDAYLDVARDDTVTCPTTRLAALAAAADVEHYFDGRTEGRLRSIPMYTTLYHEATAAGLEPLRQLAAIELCALTMELARSAIGDLTDTHVMTAAIAREWGPEYRVHFTARLMQAEAQTFDRNYEGAEPYYEALLRDIEEAPYARERSMAMLFRSMNFRMLDRYDEGIAAIEPLLELELPPHEAWRFRTRTLDMPSRATWQGLLNAQTERGSEAHRRFLQLHHAFTKHARETGMVDHELLL
jgi:hypothetical protein